MQSIKSSAAAQVLPPLDPVPSCAAFPDGQVSEKGVRLAQKVRVGPSLPVGMPKLAQLLGQLGVFLTVGLGRIATLQDRSFASYHTR